jgi:protein TonB
MTTLAHAPGGPRPADLPFHPGLQLHAIQPPRADRRLSLLISVLCYEVVAAGVLLTLQHKEAIVAQLKTRGVVVLDPVEARLDPLPPRPVQPAVPATGLSIPGLDRMTPAVPAPTDVPDTLPTGLPPNQGGSLVNPSAHTPGPVGGPAQAGPPTGSGTGQLVEIPFTQVQVVHRVEPVYPSMARLIKQQGDVVLRMTIDRAGVPTDVAVLSGPPALHAESLRVARLWRFTPARTGGEAVPAMFNLTLRYVLR